MVRNRREAVHRGGVVWIPRVWRVAEYSLDTFGARARRIVIPIEFGQVVGKSSGNESRGMRHHVAG